MHKGQGATKTNKWQLLVFIVIAGISIFFRIYKLSEIPPSLSLDEVSISYNAYSILKTGADEYSQHYPVVLRAYDDWRPALYAYTVIPFVAILGLTPIAVRLPAVIFSLVTIAASYGLVGLLFRNNLIALVTIALLSISPWHVYISRLGHEANAGLALVLCGFYFFFLSLEDASKRWLLVVSAFIFGLSLYSYQSQKIITPLGVLIILLLYRKEVLRWKKIAIISAFVGIIVSLPIVIASLNPDVSVRLRKTSVFAYHPLYLETDALWQKAKEHRNLVAQVLYSRKITSARIFLGNYFIHFKPSWLFVGGDSERHKVSGMGLLYLWEAPFILLGLIALWKARIDRRIKVVVIAWFFSSPLPAALATEAPHAMRSFSFLPIWQLFTGIGIFYLFLYVRKQILKIIIGIALLVSFSLSVITLYRQYFYRFPIHQSGSFQYALPIALDYARSYESEYHKIIVSNENNLYQSYMFYLFNSMFDPKVYQKLGGTGSGGYDVTHRIGKYEFRPIVWENELFDSGVLFIGNTSDFPYNVGEKLTIKLLNNEPAIKLISR